MQSGLYIVGTPIGNLGDMSPRAVDVLRNVDLIAVEDTRVFAKLATHFDIKTPRVSCHEHNERDVIPDLIQKMQAGTSIAVATDAGMPGVSDPGFRLVRASRDAHIPVFVVPGPVAAIAGLVLSGFPTDRFTFCGFLMKKNCAMIIKFVIRLFTMRVQIVLWRQFLQWHGLCPNARLP